MDAADRLSEYELSYLSLYLSSKGKSRFYIYDFDAPKNSFQAARKPDKIGLFAGYIFFVPS